MIVLVLLHGGQVIGQVVINSLLACVGALAVVGFVLLMKVPWRAFVAAGIVGGVVALLYVKLELQPGPAALGMSGHGFSDAMWFGGRHFFSGAVVWAVTWLAGVIGAHMVLMPPPPDTPDQPLGLGERPRRE